MNDICKTIASMNSLKITGEVSNELIINAQSDLGLSFAVEYKKYLSEFGVASFEGHELTGISSIKRLDVVDVTKNNREHINDMVKDMYVVEEINIDGIVIWQDVTGCIYETCPGCEKPKPIYNSLVEYLESV